MQGDSGRTVERWARPPIKEGVCRLHVPVPYVQEHAGDVGCTDSRTSEARLGF